MKQTGHNFAVTTPDSKIAVRTRFFYPFVIRSINKLLT